MNKVSAMTAASDASHAEFATESLKSSIMR